MPTRAEGPKATAGQTAIIADDLTGAVDVAADFAQRGAHTVLIRDLGNGQRPPCDVFAIDTSTRNVSRDEALLRLRTLERSAPWLARLLVKKVDSTWRGHPALEVAALFALAGRRHIIVALANPAQGRTMSDGLLFVHGRPLAMTSYATSDPAAADTTPIQNQLAALFPHHTVVMSDVPPPLDLQAPPTIWLAHANTDEALARVAQLCVQVAPWTLCVGSGGLTRALATAAFPRGDGVVADAPLCAPRLFVVGSRSDEARRQIAHLENKADVHMVSVDTSQIKDLPVSMTDGRLALLVPKEGGTASPRSVAQALGKVASRKVLHNNLDAVFACGGDTAAAVLEDLGIHSMTVLGTPLSGVTLSTANLNNRPFFVWMKPGGFGPDTVLADIQGASTRRDHNALSTGTHPSLP
ncbi:MAG: four-carbon acid sugar kinase family protein [Deltaproteobacteria bacterium]|nr:four-carbon acid sugar kinase family protein [Deltaproteobacteria bacterium]